MARMFSPRTQWRRQHVVGCGHTLPIRRFISRNSASAASPRRWCSSGVMSGTSLRHDRGFRAVTIADLRSSLAGCERRPMLAPWLMCWCLSGGSSGRARFFASPSAAACPPPTSGGGSFSGHDRRAGDLGQLPPLPLRRRLVAIGPGDDAGHVGWHLGADSGGTKRRRQIWASRKSRRDAASPPALAATITAVCSRRSQLLRCASLTRSSLFRVGRFRLCTSAVVSSNEAAAFFGWVVAGSTQHSSNRT